MVEKIELRAKTNKDLLIMAVMQGNETVRHLELINGSLKNHETRLKIIEAVSEPHRLSLSKKQAVGFGGGAFLLGSIIVGIFLELPAALGWW